MKKKQFMKIGYAVVALLLVSAAVIAVLALTGVIGKTEDGKPSIFDGLTITPEEKYPLFVWQNSQTEGDLTAVFETEEGSFTVKLSKGTAAEKFKELCEKGAFSGKEFSVAAEDMFIQTAFGGEKFSLADEGYGCFYGSVGFVLEKGEATDSLFIITAKTLSGISEGWLSGNSPDAEYTAFFEENGGVPQYDGKVLVFAQVTEGFDVIEKLAGAETSGYTSGYAAKNPVKITSVRIVDPTAESSSPEAE